MSAEHERPVVDVCENQNPPLAPGETNKRFNFIQRHMRNGFGTLCFAIVAMMIGAVPEIGLAPILVLSAWLGAHWAVRKFCDMSTGTWMCVMCVSCVDCLRLMYWLMIASSLAPRAKGLRMRLATCRQWYQCDSKFLSLLQQHLQKFSYFLQW